MNKWEINMARSVEKWGPKDRKLRMVAIPINSGDVEDALAEIATLRDALAASQREADRLRHSETIESDYVCPDSLRADAAEEQTKKSRRRL